MAKTIKDNFRLPDTLAAWPYVRCINPHYEEVKFECTAWLESFHAFDERKQRLLNLCDFSLCAALTFPLYDKERLRTCADALTFIFVFDEYSDREDEHGVRAQRDAIMDALRNPHMPRPAGECVLGEMMRQMWVRALPTTPSHAQQRYIDTYDEYTAAVVQEAEDRRLGKVRGIDSYLSVRRGTIGVLPMLALLELTMKTDAKTLEKELLNESIAELERLSADMCILDNDMVSYIMERDMGHGAHNIVTAVMHELQTDVPGALLWVEEEHARLIERFLEVRARVNTDNPEIEQYIWGVGNWVRGTDCWYYEGQRYFGERGLLVQRERRVDAGLEEV